MAKIAAAVAATFATALPFAAAAHPVEQIADAPAECWQTSKAQMAASVDASEGKAQKQIWVTATGMVEVAGAFKAELQESFPLVELKNGLAAACTNVKVDRGAFDAMRNVRRQFGFMQQDAERRLRAIEARIENERNSGRRFGNQPDRSLLKSDAPAQKLRPRDEVPI